MIRAGHNLNPPIGGSTKIRMRNKTSFVSGRNTSSLNRIVKAFAEKVLSCSFVYIDK
jgi:hypothetical protein